MHPWPGNLVCPAVSEISQILRCFLKGAKIALLAVSVFLPYCRKTETDSLYEYDQKITKQRSGRKAENLGAGGVYATGISRCFWRIKKSRFHVYLKQREKRLIYKIAQQLLRHQRQPSRLFFYLQPIISTVVCVSGNCPVAL